MSSDATFIVIQRVEKRLPIPRMLHDRISTSLQLLDVPIHEEQDDEVMRRHGESFDLIFSCLNRNRTAQFLPCVLG
jgi:hypothetical protein